MTQMLGDAVIAVLLVIGGVFGVIGSYGLLRLKHALQRLHAPTKASTIGLGAVLIAAALQSVILEGTPSWHEVLITIFIFLTAPLTAIYLAKTVLHRHVDPASLPSAGKGTLWASQTPDSPTRPDK